MKLTDSRLILFLAAVLVFASVASADNLTPGSGWQYFYWLNASGPTLPTTWTLDLTQATGQTELRIVDAFTSGDMFQVQVSSYPPPSGQLIARSSWVPLSTLPEYIPYGFYSPLVAQDDPDAAWSVEKYFSRIAISLPPGSTYTITISLIRTAYDPTTYLPLTSGGAYIRASCGTGCPPGAAGPLAIASSVGASAPHTVRTAPWTINGAPVGNSAKPQPR